MNYAEYAIIYSPWLIVLSGNGLAIYIGMKMPMNKNDWKKLMEQMKCGYN